MPGHNPLHFYTLLPLLAALFVLTPSAFQAIAAATGLLATIRQIL